MTYLAVYLYSAGIVMSWMLLVNDDVSPLKGLLWSLAWPILFPFGVLVAVLRW